jgi:hypothetical protein
MECFSNCEMNNIQIVMGTIKTRVLALELWTPVQQITSWFRKSEIYCRNWHTTLVGQGPLVTPSTIHKGNIGKASSNIRRSTINLTLDVVWTTYKLFCKNFRCLEIMTRVLMLNKHYYTLVFPFQFMVLEHTSHYLDNLNVS